MGDRGNVAINMHDGGTVFLYAHWGGSNLPETLRRALAREQRWDDEAYLTRIIFCEMLREGGTSADAALAEEETGFGIATYVCDNEHPILTVNCKKQLVSVGGCGGVSFAEYISAKPRSWTNLGFNA